MLTRKPKRPERKRSRGQEQLEREHIDCTGTALDIAECAEVIPSLTRIRADVAQPLLSSQLEEKSTRVTHHTFSHPY